MSEDLAHRLTPEEQAMFDGKMPVGRGCDECRNQGFLGRLGFYELIRVNASLRSAIAENLSMVKLRDHMPEDFEPMRVDGMAKASRGETTIQEVLRATQDVDET